VSTVATVAVIGEEPLVRGYLLAGAQVLPADDPEQVRAAWRRLPEDVVVVILTPAAAAVEPQRTTAAWPLTAVMS
jgi:vacuolar-type H+-ATPase subunit F/Vma7